MMEFLSESDGESINAEDYQETIEEFSETRENTEPTVIQLNPPDMTENNFKHENSKISKCKYCQKRFSSKDFLIKHMKVAHNYDRDVIQCDICNKILSSIQNLSKHKKNVHEKVFQCSYCDLVCESKYFLNKHNFETHVKESTYLLNWPISK